MPQNLILIIRDGKRLCNDRNFREFAAFGTYGYCVKQYRSTSRAFPIAKTFKAQVVSVPPECTVDMCGQVFKDEPSDKPGFVKTIKLKLEDFIVSTDTGCTGEK